MQANGSPQTVGHGYARRLVDGLWRVVRCFANILIIGFLKYSYMFVSSMKKHSLENAPTVVSSY